MTVPPNATEEEIAYAEKWTYVIQLRYSSFHPPSLVCVCVHDITYMFVDIDMCPYKAGA